MIRIWKEYRFEAAHRLPHVPEGHQCGRLHGHSYLVRVTLGRRALDESGFVMDFADLSAVVKPLIERLDHRTLNDIAGLENPTAEVIARWLWSRLFDSLPYLVRVTVQETATAGASVGLA